MANAQEQPEQSPPAADPKDPEGRRSPKVTDGSAPGVGPKPPAEEAPRRQLAEAEERLSALRAVLDEQKKANLYVQAEFDNFRKQKLREFDDLRKFAAERVVAALIDDLENLQRLEDHAAKELREAEASGGDAAAVARLRSVFEGVQRVTRHLSEALGATGLIQMETAGSIFDPSLHEALAEETRTDCKEREILRVFQKGYTMHGRVLRPAKVLVGRQVGTKDVPSEPGSGANDSGADGSPKEENKE
ncbi:MAG TPA: nucleotide exchange factor GrpE [Thermoplasmata archaeon]|nr:nucleotide exchange factor GrpE [Thermoplasmata archaeon]